MGKESKDILQLIAKVCLVAGGLVLAILGICYSLTAGAKEPAKVTVIGQSSASRSPYVSPYIIPRSFVHPIDTSASYGSGVMIAPHRMLTVRHVVKDENCGAIYEDINIVYDKKAIRANRIVAAAELDLALLDVDIDCPCATINAEQMPQDFLGAMVGYPVTNPFLQMAVEARVQGYGEKHLVLWGNASPGASGGGFFVKNSKDEWQLNGLIRAIYKSNDNEVYYITYAIPGSILADFVKKAEAFLATHNDGVRESAITN